jgi:hypothetical protein
MAGDIYFDGCRADENNGRLLSMMLACPKTLFLPLQLRLASSRGTRRA